MYTSYCLNKHLPDEYWKSYHSFVEQILKDFPTLYLFYYPSFDTFKELSLKKAQRVKIHLIIQDTTCIGVMEHLTKAKQAYLCLQPENLSSTLTSFFSTWLPRTFTTEKIRITTNQSGTCNLLTSIGGKCVIQDVVQELNIKQLTLNNVADLLETGQNYIDDHDFSYQFCAFLKEEELTNYIELYNETIKDILVFDRENGERSTNRATVLKNYAAMKEGGGKIYYLLVKDTKNDIIALNEVWLTSESVTTQMYSGLTAVKQAYRRKKLAQFVKVKMIQRLVEQYSNFTILETTNSIINYPILALNRQLGFVPISEEFIIDYQN